MEHMSPAGKVQDRLRVWILAYHLSIDVAADCDGEVGVDEPGKAKGVWGKPNLG